MDQHLPSASPGFDPARITPGRIVFYAVGWDAANMKRRPGVVVERNGDTITVVKGTSQMKENSEWQGRVISDFASVGLRKPTRFVPTTTHTLTVGQVARVGKLLAEEDYAAIHEAWSQWRERIDVGSIVWYSFADKLVKAPPSKSPAPAATLPLRPGVVVDRRSRYLTVARTRFSGEGHTITDCEAARVRPGTVVTSQRVNIEYSDVNTLGGTLVREDLHAVLALVSAR